VSALQREGPPPVEGRIDRRQLRALLEALLRQTLRPGIHSVTGAKGNPLRQIVVALGLLGLVFSFNVLRISDLEGYLSLLFAAALTFAVLNIGPDTPDAYARNREVLGCRPVSGATFLAARAAFLSVLTSLIVTCFGVVPLLAARWRFGAPWLPLGATYLTLLVAAVALVSVWLLLYLNAARVVPLERLRTATHWAVIAAVLTLQIVTLATVSTPAFADEERQALRTWLAWLPSTWFALFWVDGTTPWRRAGALAFVAAGAWSMRLTRSDRLYRRIVEEAFRPEERRTAPQLSLRLLEALRRLPPVARWLLPAQAFGVAGLVLTVGRRETLLRVRLLMPRLLATGAFVYAWTQGGGLAPLLTLACCTVAALVEGIALVRQSAHAAAAWPLFTAPLPPRQVLRGLRLALLVRALAWPYALLTIALVREHPLRIALPLSLGVLLVARIVVAMDVVLRPALPLTQERQQVQSFIGLVAGFVLSIGIAVLYALAVTLGTLLGLLGAVIVGVGVAALVPLAIVADLWAAERLRRVEMPAVSAG
jgi:hypothetical protein